MTVRVLVVAEHEHGSLHGNTAKCVACASALGAGDVDVAVLTTDASITGAARIIAGVGKVLVSAAVGADTRLSAIAAPRIAALARDYTHVLAPASTFGKDLLPRVAAVLGVGQISDIMAVEGPYRFKRPMYAGNVVVTVEAGAARPVVGTVRAASFAPAGAQAPAPVEAAATDVAAPGHTRFVELRAGDRARADLATAARVVAGGRGLGSAEGFAMVEELASTLGAAVGASRAAVDAGFAPNELQVGQTGKIIAPDLYIALGISGAIQHLTGIKDARTIVAINKDASAPIFEIADVGLVADVFEAVPELIRALKASA